MIIVACPCSQLRESSPQPYKPDEPPEIRNTPEPCPREAATSAKRPIMNRR